MRFSSISHLVLAGLALTSFISVSGQSTNDAELTCNLASQQLSLHEPVIMTLAITNPGADALNVDFGWNRQAAIVLSIVKPDGKNVTATHPVRGGLSRIGLVNIASNNTYTQRFVLNEWYPFADPGKYQIIVRLAPFREQQVSLEILPRDPARLTKTCEELVAKIENTAASAEMSEAALALSYTNDPIAVSYLQEAAQAHSGMVAGTATAGLARIDGDSGAKALISLSGSQSAEIRAVARTNLWRIMQDSKDPALKDEIKQALEKQ